MNYHEPLDQIDQTTIDHHRVIQSIVEELEAVDWYMQRASATEMPMLKELLLHNAKEEMEHVALGLEFLRQNYPLWASMFDKYMNNEELLEGYDEDFNQENEEFLQKEATGAVGMGALGGGLIGLRYGNATGGSVLGAGAGGAVELAKKLRKLKKENKEKTAEYSPIDFEDSRVYGDESDPKWRENILPRWQKIEKEINNDPKVQELNKQIKNTDEWEDRLKLHEEKNNYIENNFETPLSSDKKMKTLKNKIEKAKQKDPSEFDGELTDEGYWDYKFQQGQNIGAKLAPLTTLGGAALGGKIGSETGLAGGILGTLYGGASGAIGGLAGGAVAGSLKGKIDKKFDRIKDKGKYNKEGRIRSLKDDERTRDHYLRFGNYNL